MPIHFAVRPAERLVRYTVEGVAAELEARAFLSEVVGHPDFEPGFDFLGDARGECVPHSAFTGLIAGECLAWAEYVAPCRWAVVVASRVGLGLVECRAREAREKGVEVAAFRTEAEAANWLAAAARLV